MEDILMNSRFSDKIWVNEGVRSLLAVPLFADGRVRGVLSAGRRGVRPFSEADDESLVALAGVVADLAWPAEEGQNRRLESVVTAKYPVGLPYGDGHAATEAALEEIAGELVSYLAASAVVIWVSSCCWRHYVVRTDTEAVLTPDECQRWASKALHFASYDNKDAQQASPGAEGQTPEANGRQNQLVPSLMLPLKPGQLPIGLMAVFRARQSPSLEGWQVAVAQSAADKAGLMVSNFELSCSLRETRRKLEQIRSHKEQFLPAIGHNLRTPLTSIKGFAQLLMREYSDDALRLSQFGTIINESNRLSEVVDEMVTLDRMEATIAGMEIETISLTRLLQEVEDLLRQNGELNHRLESGLPEADVLVRGANKELPKQIVCVLRCLGAIASEDSQIVLTASTGGNQPQIVMSVFTKRLDRHCITEMLKRPYDEGMNSDHTVRGISHDLYVARNIIEAQGGTLRSRWRRAGELLLILTLPTIEKSRGKR